VIGILLAIVAVAAYGAAVYAATAKPHAPARDPEPPAFDATPEWVRRMEERS
jgi:hypothetical protein